MAIVVKAAHDPYVNENVNSYFKKFGNRVGHETMCPKRMKYLFQRWLTCPNLSELNRGNILKWLQANE